MAYWIDTALGSGDNDGTSPANAVRGTSAIKTGFEFDHDAGVDVWVRRTSAYDEGVVGLNADILPTADGTSISPVRFISWPRAAIPDTTITEGDWTNGDTTVDNIVGITAARGAHQARWVTAPDGYKYFITRVVDANTIIIDREYAGGTVTGVDGKFQIDEDEFYDIRPQAGIDASWDADAHNLPIIDFNDEAYQLKVDGDNYLIYSGYDFIDSADSSGIVFIGSSFKTTLQNILFKQNASNTVIFVVNAGTIHLKEYTIEGSGAGSSQKGYRSTSNATRAFIDDGAIFNCGDNGLHIAGIFEMNNTNIGIEIANGDDDIYAGNGGVVKGVDVKLGGGNGYIEFFAGNFAQIEFENYQKILGDHKKWDYFLGTDERIAVTATNANKKLSDFVLQITPSTNLPLTTDEWKTVVFIGNFDLDVGANTIKFWLYNDLGQTINDTHAKENVYLKASYVDSYDDITEYTRAEAFSTEIDILDAADADDWDYLEVVMTLATASRVKLELIVSIYDAADVFLIDPIPVIT